MGSHKLRMDFNQALLLLEMSITFDESTFCNIQGDDTAMCVIFIAVFQLMGFYSVLVAIGLQNTRQKKHECQWEHLWARGNMHFFSSALRTTVVRSLSVENASDTPNRK